MRTLEEHKAAVAAHLRTLPTIDVALEDARGAMLAAPVIVHEDVPPVPTAACDGYAVLAADVASAPATLPVTHDLDFDPRAKTKHVAGTAARIVSGAPMPTGADAVVPFAWTDGGIASVTVAQPVAPGQHVRAAGSEVPAGLEALAAGQRIEPRHLALASAVGLARLRVHPAPRVVVIAAGAELVEVGRGGFRSAVPETTGHLVTELVRDAGAHAYRVAVMSDSRTELRAAIEDQMVRADVIITVGGLSASPNDAVAPVLRMLGSLDVTDLALTPSGLHGLGEVHAGDRRVPVIALPGRPVEAYVAFEAYVRDALRGMSGQGVERPEVSAKVSTGWKSPRGFVQAVPVWLEDGGAVGTRALPVGDPAAPSLAAFAQANGLVFVPADADEVRAGAVLRCQTWGV